VPGVDIQVGTSGWQYADWRGAFYPAKLPQRLWLSYYVERFDTVEVNSTFYRLPSVDAVARWTDALPDGFSMVIKASRFLTHVKRLRDPAEPVERLLKVLAPLRERSMLGAVLVQLPPDLEAVPDRLDETLAQFPSGVRVAVEPRHASWFTPEFRELLGGRNAALVWADREGRSMGPRWETADWRYLRLHHGRYTWRYDERDLRRWARLLGAAGSGYVFTNNDPGAAAIADARRFRELLGMADQRNALV
jgi:uncharacterized protein YecE (DUF72 family)